MRKLVQKLVELEPYLSNNKELLQSKLDELSKDGWELCGQVGLFHIFKRWEEEVRVYQNGYDNNPPNNYQPGYYGNNGYGYNNNGIFNNYGYNNYNNNYRPPYQQPYYNNYNNYNRQQPYNNGYQPSFNYNPGVFGTPVNQNNQFNNSKDKEDEDDES